MHNQICTALAKTTADTQVLWNKVHQLHWKIQGPQFSQVHSFTEGVYDELGEHFDDLAERILMLGAKPPATLGECLGLSSVKELDAASFSAPEVFAILEKDLGDLAKSYHAIRSQAAESGDAVTDSLLTGKLEWLEKTLWIIRSSK